MTPKIEQCLADLRGAISVAPLPLMGQQAEIDYLFDRVDAVVKAVDEEINRLHTSVSNYEAEIRRLREPKPRRKREPGMKRITLLKAWDAPEWVRQVREAMEGRTIQAAADKLDVSLSTMKRFKADLGNVEKKIADGTWKNPTRT